ncbi:MAG: glycosyltransferase family A protein [Bacteroidota bacterium]
MVSVIIPTYNRAELLGQTLRSILALKTSCDLFEIIVVDNGSSDETAYVVKEFQAKTANLFYFFDEIPGLLTGRHRGANEAKGDILSFIDDDVELSETWLDTIIEVMENNSKIELLTGPNLPKFESLQPDWLSYFWTYEKFGKHCGWLSLLDFGQEMKEIDPHYVWGLNFTIRKNTFLKLKGFHPDNMPQEFQLFQGDGETGLALKARKQGIKAFYHPKVALNHFVPTSRLTYEYFEKRAFYQGVANSFSHLKGDEPIEQNNKNFNAFFVKKVMRKIGNILKNNNQISVPLEILKLKKNLHQKQNEGFDFHQQQFNENQKVKNWVLKSDYLDYQIPQND